jgi:phage tail protein X
MMAAGKQLVRSIEGDTVDNLCWRYYGKTQAVTEQVLNANPHLASLGPILPNGTEILLSVQTPAATQPLIQLWD